jgi:hypothetical protein
MKKQITLLSVAILSIGLFFTSCKKEKATTDTTDDATQLQVQSDDQARFSGESDAADDDANVALETYGGSYVGARPLTPLPIRCDADVAVDTTVNPRTITITYSGATCGNANRTRTGSIVLSFDAGFRWSAAGSQYNITYNNLKITRLSDNKSITINGTKTITNVSGGKLANLSSLGTITHTVTSAGMSVTFDNGSQRSWQVARQREFTYNDGVVISITGIAPASVGTGVAEWGTNRFGRAFQSAILQPLVLKQNCDFRLVSGQVQHTGFFVTTTTTFGLDAQGNAVTSCPVGSYYLKNVWVAVNGQTRTYIGPY